MLALFDDVFSLFSGLWSYASNSIPCLMIFGFGFVLVAFSFFHNLKRF